jgi:hypothetical protein
MQVTKPQQSRIITYFIIDQQHIFTKFAQFKRTIFKAQPKQENNNKQNN